jgi:hypothetical protein
MPIQFGGPGVVPNLGSLVSTEVSLQAGAVYLLPSGRWAVRSGKTVNTLQEYDPISQFFRNIGGADYGGSHRVVYSDGANYRIANQSGCAVGALLTTAGTGYTSAPTVAASAGGSLWRAIVGGVVSTTVTVTNGGTGYTYPPLVLVAAPPPGGIPCTMHSTLTSGAVSSVTVDDQGAGYAGPPVIAFINDPREGVNAVAAGSGAAATCVLTGAGTVAAVVCIDHGTPLATIPTLAFSGGGGGASAAATVIMNWTITAYAAGTAGAGLAGSVARITAEDAFPTTAAAYTNPTIQSNLVKIRSADIKAPISGGGISATGQVIYDGGTYTSSPTPLVIPSASVVTTAPVVTFTLGGATDVAVIMPT